MTRRIGNTVFIEAEKDRRCEYCGEVAETRPYGKGGMRICFACGMKPENKAQTEAAFSELLRGGKLQ